ncbi:MAG: phosphatase PAP2 family protein [Sphaerochaetaceae bacterium]
MQESIMLFFLQIENPVLDFLGNLASLLGEQTFVIIVILYIFWNYDKKKGFGLYSAVLLSVLAMGILKATVRAPRPFQVLESIQGKRLETATGYSFPSGHTTTGAAFYSSLALTFRNRKFSIFCAIMMTLVGLSRLYLGVHWPIDVVAGFLLGILVSFVFYHYLDSIYDNEGKRLNYLLMLGTLFALSGAVISVMLNYFSIDATAFTDLMKVLALGGGGYLGFALENRKVQFSTEGTKGKQFGRYLIGLAVVLLIMGSKVIIPDSLYAIGSYVRYSLVGFWATGLYPLIGKNLHLFSGSR